MIALCERADDEAVLRCMDTLQTKEAQKGAALNLLDAVGVRSIFNHFRLSQKDALDQKGFRRLLKTLFCHSKWLDVNGSSLEDLSSCRVPCLESLNASKCAALTALPTDMGALKMFGRYLVGTLRWIQMLQ